MQRLTYSPKAYAWVKVEGERSPFNISKYIVSGSVTRKVDAVSSAEITLRNPDMIFTRGVKQGNPFFHPMDPITIYLQRIANKPVQVFTGYLDSTPYLQLYPGPCTITASCTLKRLLHTYWDPALPYVESFMREYGWLADRKNGMLKSTPSHERDLKFNEKGDPVIDDGSIGNLLFATLKHIGDWDSSNIHIEALPEGLIRRLTDTYYAFAEDADEVGDAFNGFMKAYIGATNYGSGGTGAGDSDGGGSGATGDVKGADKVIPVMKRIADKFGIPADMVIATSLIETGLGRDMHRPGAPYWGWFQINVNGSRYSPKETTTRLLDLGIATTYFCKGAKVAAKGNPSLRKNLLQWSMYTQGVNGSNNPLYPQTWNKQIATAKSLLSKHGSKSADDSDSSDDSDGEDLFNKYHASDDSDSTEVRKSSRAGGEKTVTASSSVEIINRIVLPVARKNGVPKTVAENNAANERHDRLSASGNVSDHKGEGGTWAADLPIGTDTAKGYRLANALCKQFGIPKSYIGTYSRHESGGYSYQLLWQIEGHYGHVHFGVRKTKGGNVSADDIGDAAVGDTDSGTGGTDNIPDMLPQAKAAAFVQQMEFPSAMERAESMGLTGAKSLMNDKPLFPFIQQLSGAALRSFQSLPNGDFFAFYPDYFGTEQHRKAYWMISDIEITEGKIQLNDDALCTHMYVVGDTQGGIGSGIDKFDRLTSTGVVNIYNMAQSGFVSHNTKEDVKSREVQVGKFKSDPTRIHDFLAKYGARPQLIEAPLVRSSFFEAFLAYQNFQLAWSHQFLTDFQFTFMPEVYPGGIIGFPEHGLQLYVDEVTHSFDYTGGFTTTATLSAPASLNDSLDDDPVQYGLVRSGVSNA